MGKKHQHREHVSVRKMREEQQKLEKRRAFYRQHKKQLIIAAIALVAAVVIAWLAVDYFYTPGGSMRMFLGNLMGVEENAVIRNMGTSKAPRYYTFGQIDAPDGYVNDPTFSPPSDSKEQNFYYQAEDESKQIQSIYITGVKSRTGQSMTEEVGASGMYASITEPRIATIAGHDTTYLYATGYPSEEDQSVMYAMLILYVDTVQESSILFNCSSAHLAPDQLPTEEALLAEMEGILSGLTIPK